MVSLGLTIFVILMWRFTSKAVNKKKAEQLKVRDKVEKPGSMYDEDGDRVHFRFGSHDLGGEVVVQSWGTVENQRNNARLDSEFSQAVGGADPV